MGTHDPAASNICPGCGAAASGASRFCHYCGASLDPRAVDATRVPPPGAFRQAGLGALLPPQPPPSSGPPQLQGYAYPPPSPRAARRGWRTGIVASVVVLGCMGVFVTLVALSMRNVNQVREKAKEAEGKQNLHTIQLAVERFGVDHGGAYPAYLIGGEARFTDSAFAMEDDVVQDCADRNKLCDPLLREGYLDTYPANPFVKQWEPEMYEVHGAQLMPLLDPLRFGLEDPLSSGTPECSTGGTRFGARSDLMGQVLADLRYPEWELAANPGATIPSFADIGYKMWDIEQQRRTHQYLPGQFFYKSHGAITIQNAMAHGYGADQPLTPERVTDYMLGVYGGAKAKGKDVIGPEQALRGMNLPDGKAAPPVWTWTRSNPEMRMTGNPTAEDLAGSPYSAVPDQPELQYGNPNAIRDGVVLVLTTP